MGRGTPIQWCDDTVNPVMGCSGCELYPHGDGDTVRAARVCYAGTDHERRSQVNPGYAPTFFLPTLFAGRVAKAAKASDLTGTKRADKPWLDGMPRLIFVSDMGDALSDAPFGQRGAVGNHVLGSDVLVTERRPDKNGVPRPSAREARPGSIQDGGVPFDFLKTEIIDVAFSADGRRHQWLWLTKLPARMAKFSRWLTDAHGIAWPSNVWAGTSVTGKGTLQRAHEIAGVGDDETVRFLSVEPQWHDIGSLAPAFDRRPGGRWWVICGGESQQRAGQPPRRYDLAWPRQIRDECRTRGISFFLKQIGGNAVGDGLALERQDPRHGGDMQDWPEDLRVRELPSGPWSEASRKPAPFAVAVPRTGARHWTPEDVVRWSSRCKPHVRAAIALLAADPEGFGVAELNARVGGSGGATVGGLQAWAARDGLMHPLVRRGHRFAFADKRLAGLFATQLRPSEPAAQTAMTTTRSSAVDEALGDVLTSLRGLVSAMERLQAALTTASPARDANRPDSQPRRGHRR